VDVDRNASLGGTCRKGDRQLGIATATGPGRGAILYTQVSIRSIHVGCERVGVIGLHRNRLVALASRRAACYNLKGVRAAMHW
jgi:hypothetical protein